MLASREANFNFLPVPLKELLRNLEYLSMIEKGKKPCLSDMTFVKSSSWYGALKRARNSESKKSLLQYIDHVVEQALTAILDPKNREYLPVIISSLSRAKLGISNTQTTYQHHPSFVSSIRVTLKNIDLQLAKYDQLIETNLEGIGERYRDK